MVSSERSSSYLSEYSPFNNLKYYYFINKYQFLGEKLFFLFFLCSFFLKIFPKFSDFVNSDDWIRKITYKSVRPQLVYIKKKLKLIRNGFFTSEKNEKFT